MKRIIMVLAAGVAAGGLAGFIGAEHSSAAPPPASQSHPAQTQPAGRVVFAVPFENATGQDQYDPAAAGLADLVAVMLAEQKQIKVVERQRLEALTAEQAKSLQGLTGTEYAVKAGRLVKADTVITGRLFLVEEKLTANVKAIDIGSQAVIASDQISCRPTYLVEGALQMARNLARQMLLPLPEIDPEKIDKSPIASLHFAKALGFYYAGNMDEAIMHFMRTTDLDPDYAEAHYWSGLAYHKLEEDAMAAVEWRAFLRQQPGSPLAAEASKLLEEAGRNDRSRRSGSFRSGPPTASTTGRDAAERPTSQPAK